MTTIIDAAGAWTGGAARFLQELDAYLDRFPRSDVQIIGRDRSLTPSWLIQREHVARTAKLRIALNNASFVSGSGTNITLLRNALHFSQRRETEELHFTPSFQLRAQTPVIRLLARRSNTLVAPSSAMADRVTARSPALANRLTVRAHPVSPPKWAGTLPSHRYTILVPVVPAPYKNLNYHVDALLDATRGLHPKVTVLLTGTAREFGALRNIGDVEFIGRQNAKDLSHYWKLSGAAFYPTKLEAFGYPLAEARVNGRAIIARDTRQNRAIASHALMPYDLNTSGSLRKAVRAAFETPIVAEPHAFNNASYFDWLLTGAPR